jgi:hypothetical protein
VPAIPGLRAPGAVGFQGRAGELVLLLLLLLTAGSFTCAQNDITKVHGGWGKHIRLAWADKNSNCPNHRMFTVTPSSAFGRSVSVQSSALVYPDGHHQGTHL